MDGLAPGCDSAVNIDLTFQILPEISTHDTCVCEGANLDIAVLVEEDNAEAGTISFHETKAHAEANTNAIGNH